MNFSEYTTKEIEEVFHNLKTSKSGLSEEEAKKRLQNCGLNEVKTKKVGLLDIFFRQFKSPFFYLLFVASVIAFLIGEKIDGSLILFFVFINVFLGFFQEAKAQKAVFLLKKYLPLTARVLREGKEKIINKTLLVPGDIVLLEPGNIVPADLRISKVQDFLADESILTGEPFPVGKTAGPLVEETKEIFKAKNVLFAGTSIISGEAEGIVIATAKKTVFGEIAKLAAEIPKESVYEKNILKLSRIILRIVVVTIVFIFLVNLAVKGTANLFDFLIFSIALVVSIIPEALPLVVTFSLSNGALKLAKEKVVVKRLSAVEDLGDIEILCTDKTGTLTENKLEMESVYSQDREKCLLYGLLSSSYVEEEIESALNPFDSAVFEKASGKIRNSLKDFRTVAEIPFNTLRLRNSALLEDKNKNLILIVKGAPETILDLSSKIEGGQSREILKEEIKKQGEAGRRILAVAFKPLAKPVFSEEDEKGLNFLGYFSFADPLKKTAKNAVRLSKELNLKIKILTGDGKEVAGRVAKEIKLIEDAGQVISGETLNSLLPEDFEKACEEFSVFARISPQTKYKIIEALQKKYEVGFLGEGINDVPALKAANLAIAVKGAADISREVSDIVLLKKDLKVIVNGVKEGRRIFSNTNKYIKCTLASNFGNFYSIALISLMIPFLPMLPTQILLVNLLSDFPLISVASDKIDTEESKRPKLYLLNKIFLLIVLLALVSFVFDFIFFGIFYKSQPALLQTLWFIESVLTEIVLIFSVRTSHFFLKARRPSFLLTFFSAAVFLTTVLLPFTNFGQEIFHFTSPPLPALLIVFSLVLVYFVISEAVKLIYFRRFKLNHDKKFA
ncbi:MAG TPA: HAD-IC family P-type ATPase [Patescibacteria group bacterium]|nr:HAD-IC family P-type ATPase [Patescibacteria group bacterium]